MALPGLPGLPDKPDAGAIPASSGTQADPATGPGAGGPTSSPMATPQPMEGMQKAARIQVQAASEMLQRELPHFPLNSPEFKALDEALRKIAGVFGKSKDEDSKLFPADIINRLATSGMMKKSPTAQAMVGPGGPQKPPMAPAPQPSPM